MAYRATPCYMDKERYRAAMVLGGVGDALGFKNGQWECCLSGPRIHRELHVLGDLNQIKVKPPEWILSDDTVMHIATGKAIVRNGLNKDKECLFSLIATEYKTCMFDMKNRLPGPTCWNSCKQLDPNRPNGYRIPFNPRGGGCGAAMRAMCIGLRYPREDQLQDLIEVSIESGRMTHHHPTGYLGSLAAALFTAYAIQNKSIREWGAGLIATLPTAKQYICAKRMYVQENVSAWGYFEERWIDYLKQRHILDGKEDPIFPPEYSVRRRDEFYKSVSYDGWGGSSGHDAPMIAYDALLGCQGNWEKLCNRAMFHGGDSDSTGIISGCLYGAMHGYKGVPDANYKEVEYRDRLEDIGEQIYNLATI